MDTAADGAVRCVRGSDDRVFWVGTAKATVAAYPSAALWQDPSHGHMRLVEAGADAIPRWAAQRG